jgi:ligand-binding sensor domain-containing protein
MSIKLFISIVLCSSLYSCYGPQNKAKYVEGVNTSDSKLLKEEKPPEPMIFPNFTNQIAETVRVMFHDSRGILWFGTHGGVFKLLNGKLIHIDGIKSELGKGIAIRAIKEDINGIIWFGHSDGISYVDKEKVGNLYESDGLISNDVWSIETDSKGNIWIGTIDGVSVYNGRALTAYELPEGKIDTTLGVSSTKMIHNIMEDSKGRIWFCTNGGVYINENNKLTEISEKDGLKTNFTNKVIETQNGEFLITTSKGLYLYNDDSGIDSSRFIFDETKGTSNVIECSNGDIWFNCSRSIYCRSQNELREYRITEGNYGPLAYQIYKDRYERVWFVGWGGAFRFENGKILNITKDGPW